MPRFNSLDAGDPAPIFFQRSPSNPSYAFDLAGGRYVVLCFFASASEAHARAAIAAVHARGDIFDDVRANFYGVSNDPTDETEARVENRYPGYRHFYDFDQRVARLYGAAPLDGNAPADLAGLRRFWIVLDPTLRVLRRFPFADNGGEIGAVLAYLDGLPPPARFAGAEIQAPVIVLPNVFEPEFCRTLIELYDRHGGRDSGVTRDVDGATVILHTPKYKSRRDCVITDAATIGRTRALFHRRIIPEIRKVHQFEATRMERYIVACYTAEDGGFFSPHRDNTTLGTAHRRFAVSVCLNDDYDGGEVVFPEYGPRGIRPPAGGALVFSCSLLHAVTTVTRGRRVVFLPFLYDEAAVQVRLENNRHLGKGVATYKPLEPFTAR